MIYLAILVALQASWAWAYRGGSTGLPIPYTRWASLMATPVFVCGALALSAPETTGLYEWGALVLGGILMFSAQADGWGRQMDLGDNDKPDNETGYQIRDLIFESKSSFSRDLVGLYMRMFQFSPVIGAFWFFDPLSIIIPLFLVLGAPLVWVAEHVWLKPLGPKSVPWNDQQPVAWVEWGIGTIVAALTVVVVVTNFNS